MDTFCLTTNSSSFETIDLKPPIEGTQTIHLRPVETVFRNQHICLTSNDYKNDNIVITNNINANKHFKLWPIEIKSGFQHLFFDDGKVTGQQSIRLTSNKTNVNFLHIKAIETKESNQSLFFNSSTSTNSTTFALTSNKTETNTVYIAPLTTVFASQHIYLSSAAASQYQTICIASNTNKIQSIYLYPTQYTFGNSFIYFNPSFINKSTSLRLTINKTGFNNVNFRPLTILTKTTHLNITTNGHQNAILALKPSTQQFQSIKLHPTEFKIGSQSIYLTTDYNDYSSESISLVTNYTKTNHVSFWPTIQITRCNHVYFFCIETSVAVNHVHLTPSLPAYNNHFYLASLPSNAAIIQPHREYYLMYKGERVEISPPKLTLDNNNPLWRCNRLTVLGAKSIWDFKINDECTLHYYGVDFSMVIISISSTLSPDSEEGNQPSRKNRNVSLSLRGIGVMLNRDAKKIQNRTYRNKNAKEICKELAGDKKITWEIPEWVIPRYTINNKTPLQSIQDIAEIAQSIVLETPNGDLIVRGYMPGKPRNWIENPRIQLDFSRISQLEIKDDGKEHYNAITVGSGDEKDQVSVTTELVNHGLKSDLFIYTNPWYPNIKATHTGPSHIQLKRIGVVEKVVEEEYVEIKDGVYTANKVIDSLISYEYHINNLGSATINGKQITFSKKGYTLLKSLKYTVKAIKYVVSSPVDDTVQILIKT